MKGLLVLLLAVTVGVGCEDDRALHNVSRSQWDHLAKESPADPNVFVDQDSYNHDGWGVELGAHLASSGLISLDPGAPEISSECRNQLQTYQAGLHSFHLWALKMHDSTAKVTAGVLNGNVNQLGDFDQCLSISHQLSESSDKAIQGKYCLASFQIYLKPNASEYMKKIHRLVHSHYLFKSDIEDTEHRVPQFSSMKWGLCVPSGCSSSDVVKALKPRLETAALSLDLDLRVRIDERMCQINQDAFDLKLGSKITISIFAVLLLVVLLSTANDVHSEGKMNKTLQAFSLKHNMVKLLDVNKATDDDIGVVHGIRFLNSIMLILSHKSMAIIFFPFINRTSMAEQVGKPWVVISRAASLYTDPFLMCSGLLTTYALLRRLNKKGCLHLPTEYMSRFIRIVPPFASLILFCTWVMPLMNSGPFWNQVVMYQAVVCKQYWWRNMMFIHNYFGFEKMCLTHTHHVGIDTQLFLVTPPLVLALVRWPTLTSRALLAAATLSTLGRYVITLLLHLSNYVSYGISTKQLFATADNMYTLPPYRATVYIMGILLGYLLHHSKTVELTKSQLRVGWAIATMLLGLTFAGTQTMGVPEYKYDATQAANYAALAPVTWCAFFCWLIYTSQLGYSNWLSKVFSWKWFALWTKISYAVYLTQYPVFFYYVGVTRAPLKFDVFEQLLNWREYFVIIVSSFALTLFVEMPSQNIRNALLRRVRTVNKVVEPTLTHTDLEDLKLRRKSEDLSLNKAVNIVERYRHMEEQKMK